MQSTPHVDPTLDHDGLALVIVALAVSVLAAISWWSGESFTIATTLMSALFTGA